MTAPRTRKPRARPRKAAVEAKRPPRLAEAATREAMFMAIVGGLAFAGDAILDDAIRSTGSKRTRSWRTFVLVLRNLAEVSGARVAKGSELSGPGAALAAGGEGREEWEKLPAFVQARLPADFATLPKKERMRVVQEVAADLANQRARLARASSSLERSEDPTEADLEGEEVEGA